MSPTMSLVIGIIIGSFTAMILIVIIVLKVTITLYHDFLYLVLSSTWNQCRNNLTLFFRSFSGIVVSFLFHSSLKSTKRFVAVFLYRCVLESSNLFSFWIFHLVRVHSWLILQVRTGVDITEYKQVHCQCLLDSWICVKISFWLNFYGKIFWTFNDTKAKPPAKM